MQYDFYNPADRGVVVVVVMLDWTSEEAISVEKVIIKSMRHQDKNQLLKNK